MVNMRMLRTLHPFRTYGTSRMKKLVCLLTATLLLLLSPAANAQGADKSLDYGDLPGAHRAVFEKEIEYALAHARARAPGEDQLFAMARGLSNGYVDSVSRDGIAFTYAVNESIIKVGESIRFTVSDVTGDKAPIKYSVAGLLMDENFVREANFAQVSGEIEATSWDGRTFTYTPTKAGYVIFVLGISTGDGTNVVTVSTNTIQVYADEKPLFRNMAVHNDLAAVVSLDDAKSRVGDVITATAMLTTKTGPVKYTATWTLCDQADQVLDTKTSTGQMDMAGQVQTIHFDYWPLQAGQTQFEFTATDGDGNAIRINSPGMAVLDGFAFSAALDRSVVSLGESLTGTYRISGHVCDSVRYSIGWTCYDAADPDKVLSTVSTQVDTRTGTSTFTPRFGGQVEFFARATCDHYPDVYPAYDRATLLYGVNARLSLTASTVKSGSSIGLNYEIADGLTPYQRIQITGCTYDQDTNRTYQFLQQTVTTAEGKVTGKPYLGDLVYFEITVTEKDGYVSTWRSDTIPLTDAPTVSAPALAASVDAETLELGKSVTLTYQMTGGSGSVSKEDKSGSYAAWQKVDGTIVSTTALTTTFGTVTFTPKEDGEYVCIMMLTDAYGQRVTWKSDSIYVGKVRIPGDADGNGAVSMADAQRIIDHCADASVLLHTGNADVNGDGKVDLEDALLLMQFCAGWGVQLN